MILRNNKSNTLQAFWIAMGQLIAVCLTIGSTMVLTRYMDKFNYGTYKQIFYVYSTLLSVFTLGLPKSYGYFLSRIPKEEGKDFVNKMTKIFIFSGLFFSFLLFFASPIMAEILKNKELAIALKMFSPVPVFLLPTLGLEAIYATYRGTYVAAIYSVVTRVLLFICVTLPVFFFNMGYKCAIAGFVFSSFLSFILALYLKSRPFRNTPKKQTSISVKYILKFCIPLMGAGIFNIFINSTDQFFISRYFGTETFADFSNGAMELPFIGMVVGACSTVLLPIYSKLSKNNSLSNGEVDGIISIWNSVLSKTVMLIYPLIIYCIVFSNEIMVVLYGSQYESSGKYFFIMLFNNFISIISCYPLLLALNKTKEYGIVYFFNFIILVLLEYCAVLFFHSVESICIISVLCLWMRVFVFIKIISNTLRVSIHNIIPYKTILIVIIQSVIVALTIRSLMIVEKNVYSIFLSLMLFGTIIILSAKLFKINYLAIIKPLLKI